MPTRRKTNSQSPALDRRTFLGATALGALAAGSMSLTGPAWLRRARAADAERPVARNLIFMVSDGMSMGTLQITDLAIRRRHGRRSHWVELILHPQSRRSIVDTSALDSIVTDSAAAATAWGIGELVNNGAVGFTPDGRSPTPILVHAKQAGKATGLVTTTRLSHATPAGFIANVLTGRDDEGPIAEQILERGVDVMLGGGTHFFTPEIIGKHAGIDVVRTRDELLARRAAPGRRLLGLFSEQHLAYEIDRDLTSQPHIAEMTRAALSALEGAPGGFVMQIEGGRVDHAAHANDAGALIRDQEAFDEAIGVVMDFWSRRDDTLVIITTDHGNANPGITDYGARGSKGFDRLCEAKRSFEWISEQRKALDPEPRKDGAAVAGIVQQATGVMFEADEQAILQRWIGGEKVDPFWIASGGTGPLGSLLANHFAVAFLSTNHTSDFVELTSIGPGSAALPMHTKISDAHALMVKALDLPEAKPI